jgi:PadR family transcriptional regulator, regulatory protein PadR
VHNCPIGHAAVISRTFGLRYSLPVSDGPIRVTEPLLDVLDALLEARDHELYGWAITKATKRSSPTVYKILERLTDHGMVTARWEDQRTDIGRPRRRLYRLTGHGRASRTRPAVGWAGA